MVFATILLKFISSQTSKVTYVKRLAVVVNIDRYALKTAKMMNSRSLELEILSGLKPTVELWTMPGKLGGLCQYHRSQIPGLYPRQNQKAGIVDDQREISFALNVAPADQSPLF
jgi:hypothetical protein